MPPVGVSSFVLGDPFSSATHLGFSIRGPYLLRGDPLPWLLGGLPQCPPVSLNPISLMSNCSFLVVLSTLCEWPCVFCPREDRAQDSVMCPGLGGSWL